MLKLLALGSVLAMAAACSAGAQPSEEQARSERSGGSGQRSFEVGAFAGVSVEGSHNVIVTVGGAPSVRAEGDPEVLERLDIRVEGDTLKVGTQRGNWSWSGRRSANVYVTVPSLNSASIAGSGDLRIDRAEAPRFAASIAGSGDMEIGALRAGSANFRIAGSGGIRAAGEAEQADISIAGSGDVTLDSLATQRAEVSLMGSGDVSVRASESVSGSIMGSGDVTVHGGASCSVRKMGSGDVRCGA